MSPLQAVESWACGPSGVPCRCEKREACVRARWRPRRFGGQAEGLGERRGHWACQGRGGQLCWQVCLQVRPCLCDTTCGCRCGPRAGGLCPEPLAVTPCSFIPQPLENVYLLSALYISCKWGHTICAFLCVWLFSMKIFSGIPWWLSGKESACQCSRHEFDP